MKTLAEQSAYTIRSHFNWTAALLLAAAAAIHFAVLGAHFEEWFLYGVFFAVVAWFQAGWALLVVARANQWVYAIGVAANLSVVGVWALTRTYGIPIGPAGGVIEGAAFADLAATTFELLLALVLTFLLLGTRWHARGVDRAHFWAGMATVALLIIGSTVAALISLGDGGGGEHHHEASIPTIAYPTNATKL